VSATTISPPPSARIPDLATLELAIETPRLMLQPIDERHAAELFPYASDPDVARLMSWAAHASVDDTAAFVAAMLAARTAQTDLLWAIVPKEGDGKAIGCIGLSRIEWQFRAWRVDRAELGYWMGKPFWGQGLMSEAAHGATSWSFETLGLHKLTIGCRDGNTASQRIIEKLGFRFLAVYEDDFWRDNQWWNHLRYEQTAAEWSDSSRTLRFSKRPRL
jgi:ribosomal-protein-alanine N-acetyltransferase